MGDERTVFLLSAFRHGYAAEDYREVLRNRSFVVRSRRGIPNVYEVLGRNDAGDYLHVVTRRELRAGMGIVIVFHMSRMDEADRRWFRQRTGT